MRGRLQAIGIAQRVNPKDIGMEYILLLRWTHYIFVVDLLKSADTEIYRFGSFLVAADVQAA